MANHLKGLSNSVLVVETKVCVEKERSATLLVLEHLREVYDRRLHLELGYSSLHEFCVRELKYSDGSAYRRIQAMKLCEEVPRAKEAIASGSLSLCVAASVNRHLTQEAKSYSSSAEKEALVIQMQGKSKRECEQLLEPASGTKIEFLADDETLQDLTRLGELLAIPRSEMGSLIKKIARMACLKLDPLLKKTGNKTTDLAAKKSVNESKIPTGEARRPTKNFTGGGISPNWSHLLFVRVPIPAALKRAVWIRDQGQCTFRNALTGQRCTSRFDLEIDHRIPVACGGPTIVENLRLLCHAHHRLVTERVFGREKIQRHFCDRFKLGAASGTEV